MKKVLCISDSLGLPRPEVKYEETWIKLLKLKYPEFDYITLFRRALTSSFLSEGNFNEYLKYYDPNIVILQLGIVDCAPRYLRDKSIIKKIERRLPIKLKSYFWFFWKSTHDRKIDYSEVSLSDFENNLRNYFIQCKTLGVEKVIVVKICTPAVEMVKKNPLIVEAVNLYNNVFDNVSNEFNNVTVINPLHVGESEIYLEDGYHTNYFGNKLVGESIMNELANLMF